MTVYPTVEMRHGAYQTVDSSQLCVHSPRYATTIGRCTLSHNLYLVRHGEVCNPNHVVYGNLPGFHLSPTGVHQAHCTGAHLGRASVDLILSSPLDRALETATAIARRHTLQPTVDDRLTETRQFQHWTGHRWDSIPKLFPGELESYLEDASGAGADEQLSDVAERYLAVLHDAVAKGPTGIVIVGHQDPIQATRLSLIGRHLSDLWVNPPGHGEVVTLTGSGGQDWVEESRWSPPARAS